MEAANTASAELNTDLFELMRVSFYFEIVLGRAACPESTNRTAWLPPLRFSIDTWRGARPSLTRRSFRCRACRSRSSANKATSCALEKRAWLPSAVTLVRLSPCALSRVEISTPLSTSSIQTAGWPNPSGVRSSWLGRTAWLNFAKADSTDSDRAPIKRRASERARRARRLSSPPGRRY